MGRPPLPGNRLETEFLGRRWLFRRQSALEQLALHALALELAGRLARRGLGGREGLALAHNCALLWQMLEDPPPPGQPEGLLGWLSAGQVAALCRRCRAGWQEKEEQACATTCPPSWRKT